MLNAEVAYVFLNDMLFYVCHRSTTGVEEGTSAEEEPVTKRIRTGEVCSHLKVFPCKLATGCFGFSTVVTCNCFFFCDQEATTAAVQKGSCEVIMVSYWMHYTLDLRINSPNLDSAVTLFPQTRNLALHHLPLHHQPLTSTG